VSSRPIRAPQPAWRTPGTRWKYLEGRQAGRVFVVSRWLPGSRRVRCRIESDDAMNGGTVSLSEAEFVGRARRLLEVGEQLVLDQNEREAGRR